eukprot:4551833-Alexandrium_andersonii.AAC.1
MHFGGVPPQCSPRRRARAAPHRQQSAPRCNDGGAVCEVRARCSSRPLRGRRMLLSRGVMEEGRGWPAWLLLKSAGERVQLERGAR